MNGNQTSQLRFSSLNEVAERLELLSKVGYTQKGQWNLAQTCEHLSDWFSYMMEGYPRLRFPLSWIVWTVRVTVGRSMLRRLLNNGQMQRGGATFPETVHEAEGLSDERSIARLKERIRQFSQHHGPYRDSPLFGKFSSEEGLALQLIHCAHHMSFLEPKNERQKC